MNSWRDIKTDPPELRKPIVATDGKDVFFGKLTYGGFEGIDVQDGNFIAIIGEMANLPLTGWMPPPRTWELGEEKTAEEAFRELGLRRVNGTRPEEVLGYSDGRWEVYLHRDGTVHIWSEYNGLGLNPGMIKACAKLIQEMEESK